MSSNILLEYRPTCPCRATEALIRFKCPSYLFSHLALPFIHPTGPTPEFKFTLLRYTGPCTTCPGLLPSYFECIPKTGTLILHAQKTLYTCNQGMEQYQGFRHYCLDTKKTPGGALATTAAFKSRSELGCKLLGNVHSPLKAVPQPTGTKGCKLE